MMTFDDKLYCAGVVDADDSKQTDSESDPEKEMFPIFFPRLECVLALPKLFFDDAVFEWSVNDVEDIELLLLTGFRLGAKKSLQTFRDPECVLELRLQIFSSLIRFATGLDTAEKEACLLMAARAQTSKAS